MKWLFILTIMLTACRPTIAPGEAYNIESARCAKKSGDDVRKCQNLVDNKYGRYLNEGELPPLK